MPLGYAQFIGSSGQYYVAYCLTVRGIHATITLGNVLDVDIVAASTDGSKMLAIQVKTSRWAYRRMRYGYELREWRVGNGAAGRWSKELWYAFVDLHEKDSKWQPTVFIVPSTWAGRFVQPSWSPKFYTLRKALWRECEERGDRVSAFLAGDPAAREWSSRIPLEALEWDCSGNPIMPVLV